MAINAFGIDLGTNNIKIYNRNDDKVIVQKNMIAIENKNTLFAYGDSAFEMYEKAPGNIHISYPLSNGNQILWLAAVTILWYTVVKRKAMGLER